MEGKEGFASRKASAKRGQLLRIRLQKLYYSLTGKLIVTIGVSMVLVSAIFWFFLIRYQENELLKNTINYGLFFVEHVKKSTRYGMLIFHRELIQTTIEEIGSVEGVINVRIFDNKCKIKYSSASEEVGAAADKASPVCKGCHPGRGKLAVKRGTKWVVSRDNQGYRVLNITKPIYNEPACYTADCHIHQETQKTLGMVEANLSMAAVDMAMKKQKEAIAVYIISFIVVISLLLCIILWKFVSKPVALLIEGMEKAGRGNLEHTVQVKSKDEMGTLADAFNAMKTDLKHAKEYLESWAKVLEEEVLEKTEEIRRSHTQLLKTEKLASLGKMAAGVAHEINNPLTGIVTFAHLMLKRAAPGSEEQKDLEVIIEQANRCTKIIKGLLGFARATDSEKRPVNVNEVLDSSIQMLSSKADFQNIHFVVSMDETLGHVIADPSQIQQIFLNILFNASDAMDGRGTITINTRKVFENEKAFAEVEFTDTGPGIPEEDISKIFEPFFTTKPVGEGTGLGLAVCHGILEEHGGNIRVKSNGEGVSFFVRLPLESGGGNG